VVGLLFGAAAEAQKFPLHEVRVEGAERLSAGAVIVESGLRIGGPVDQTDFEEASGRLQGSGFFSSVRFAYQPKTVEEAPGFSLTLRVEEVDQLRPVIFDIPALGGVDVLGKLAEIAPFAHAQIADTPEADNYYRAGLEELVAAETGSPEEISSDIYNDFKTGELTYIFRPKVLPRLQEFEVEGASALSTGRIHEAIDHLVIGEEYTERRFRAYLTENILPLYGELGRLKATFEEVSSTSPAEPGGPLHAIVRVAEGGEYELLSVDLRGDAIDASTLSEAANFPVGKRANQKKIGAGLEAIRTELSRGGYLSPQLNEKRVFDDAALQVRIGLQIERGPLFTFGSLTLAGLDPKAEATARKRWKLTPGDPMNNPYVDDYLKEVLQRVETNGVGRQMKVREGTTIVDLTITFR